MSGWRPIETAPKDVLASIILGFAPDEEGFSPPSREGFWSEALGRWSSSVDPAWEASPQPTHWMPLPDPPSSAPEPVPKPKCSHPPEMDGECAFETHGRPVYCEDCKSYYLTVVKKNVVRLCPAHAPAPEPAPAPAPTERVCWCWIPGRPPCKAHVGLYAACASCGHDRACHKEGRK